MALTRRNGEVQKAWSTTNREFDLVLTARSLAVAGSGRPGPIQPSSAEPEGFFHDEIRRRWWSRKVVRNGALGAAVSWRYSEEPNENHQRSTSPGGDGGTRES